MKSKIQNTSKKILSISLIGLVLCLFVSVCGATSVNAAPNQPSTETLANHNQANSVLPISMYPRFLDSLISGLNKVINTISEQIKNVIDINTQTGKETGLGAPWSWW